MLRIALSVTCVIEIGDGIDCFGIYIEEEPKRGKKTVRQNDFECRLHFVRLREIYCEQVTETNIILGKRFCFCDGMMKPMSEAISNDDDKIKMFVQFLECARASDARFSNQQYHKVVCRVYESISIWTLLRSAFTSLFVLNSNNVYNGHTMWK